MGGRGKSRHLAALDEEEGALEGGPGLFVGDDGGAVEVRDVLPRRLAHRIEQLHDVRVHGRLRLPRRRRLARLPLLLLLGQPGGLETLHMRACRFPVYCMQRLGERLNERMQLVRLY